MRAIPSDMDVHGNVWEWVQDNWHGTYAGAPSDASVWAGGDASQRVLRGGGWTHDPGALRSAFRFQTVLGDRLSFCGFRVARAL